MRQVRFLFIALVLTTSCTSHHAIKRTPAQPAGLRAPQTIGAAGSHLTLTPPSKPTGLRISAAEAKARMVSSYVGYQPSLGPLVLFTLADAEWSGGGLGGPGASIRDLHGRTFWVGVWRVNLKSAETSCPAQPPKPPFPPLYSNYYDAVLVDAHTGQFTIWTEDMSGFVLRECARALSSPSPR